jgi:hypothetical protein
VRTPKPFTIAALFVAVALGSLGLNAGAGVDGVGSELTSSSGGCVPPSLAVDLFTDAALSSGAVELGPDTGCEQVCDEFVERCMDITNVARKCSNDGGGDFAALVRKSCRTIANRQDQDACVADVNFVRGEIQACVTTQDHDHGFSCCQNSRSACLSECLGSIWSNVPACFTGAGGFEGGSCFFQLFNGTL